MFTTPPRDSDFDALYQTLASRQNSAGGLGLWMATPEADEFVSAYAGLFFIEIGGTDEPALMGELKRHSAANAGCGTSNKHRLIHNRSHSNVSEL